jgi:hypothetical protein
MQSVCHEIKRHIKDSGFILFEINHEPVPHSEILRAIQRADFGVIAYPPNASTENTIPTKLFEYMGYRLPIILINHTPWVAYCRPYSAAIPFQQDKIDAAAILDAMSRQTFYSKPPDAVFWEAEEHKLLQTVAALLN